DAHPRALRRAERALLLEKSLRPDLVQDAAVRGRARRVEHHAPFPSGSAHSMSTFPPDPARAVANASSHRSAGNRSVMTGDTSSPEPSMAVMRYQVSNIWRP